ncbi:hypothetical protein DYQ86_00905 [Acidobacteria bacterium AB60]|nr:hypothetical protein DYQ86_00905 [Acidobacteria bacterium AB60]
MITDRFQALPRRVAVSSCMAALVMTGGTIVGVAQGNPGAAPGQPGPAAKVAPHRKSSPAKLAAAPVPDPPPPPPAPEPPKWPVNDAPAPPSVKWNSQGLQVEAPNSSLKQILDDVATTTGAKVEGLGPDERVFGSYGPGPARDVLSQILHGSSYNVLMLGDQGEGTPREIILSQRSNAPAPNQANNRPAPQDDDADQAPPQMPEPDEPNRQTVVPPMNQPMNQPMVNQPNGPMTPQQRMLEMQRQQIMMQQQQQMQQGQPIQPQPPQQ